MRNIQRWAILPGVLLAFYGCAASAQEKLHLPPTVWTDSGTIAAFEKNENAKLVAADAAIVALLKIKGARTIKNTLELFDEAMLNLEDANWFATLVQDAHPDQAFREKGSAYFQKSEAAMKAIALNRGVYDALSALDVSKADPATQYYVRRKLQLIRLAGVDRSEADRARLKQLNEELAGVEGLFNRNYNDDQRAIFVKPEELEGLPKDYIESHKPGAGGLVRITTDRTDIGPVMSYAESETLRRRLLFEYESLGYPKNHDALLKMLQLRFQIASLLGYRSWAEYNAASRMAQSAKSVSDFIQEIAKVAEPAAEREYAQLLQEKKKWTPGATQVGEEEWGFLAENIGREKFHFDSATLRPYLPVEAVKRGLLDTASKMFHVTFRQEKGVPVWEPSVETWDVFEDGSPIGRIYLDLFPRPGKTGIEENAFVRTGKLGKQLAESAVLVNLHAPTASDPGLMDLDEVVQLFHEFGHAMHRTLAGSRLRWAGASNRILEADFLEVSSQLFEKFPTIPSVLTSFARHYQTGKPIPAEMMERINRASMFGRGLSTLAYAAMMGLSLELYNREPAGMNIDALCAEQFQRYSPLKMMPGTHFYASFGYLTDMSSGFYVYTWDAVIVEDFFNQFDRKNPFAGDTAVRYRRTILEPGGSVPANDMVKNFLGRPQNMEAYKKWLEEEFELRTE